MKPEWKDFLINAGAEFSDTKVESFGNPERERQIVHSGDTICDLSHYGLIAAYGEDAETFLQGQFTNDINHVDLDHSQLSSFCTPKGRMLANFRVFKRNETWYLSLPYELVEPTLSRLRMFVMRSKVTLENADDAMIRFGLNGPKAADLLKDILGPIPEDIDTVTQHGNYTILRVAGSEPRFEIYGLLESMTRLWQSLDVDAAPVGASIWELLNIKAGIPFIVAQTSEAFVPQMANMELINGVDFKKGCYTGQEIVARMHYLGKLKRRMYRINIETDQAPMPGDSLYAEESKGGTGTGTIVNAQQQADGSYDALAVIQITDAENQSLRLHDATGPEIKILDLPYSLTEEQ
jgi:folate-binding protein YgfZ